jgi:C-3',4' desaturase CrtD
MRVVVVGAGVGGLTTAALLLKAGHPVTVLEAHVYPGGCAGTFYHQGYRFDAGATLAGGFAPGASAATHRALCGEHAPGGPHARLAEALGLSWPIRPVDPAWVVHLPDRNVTQWTDPARWRQERHEAFPRAGRFWNLQETLAGIAWDISSRPFPWPPESAHDLAAVARALRPHTARAVPYFFKTVRDVIPDADPVLKTFVDAQLMIAAQAISDQTGALYGCAALDLPRRGVSHVQGGIGALARTLVDWIRRHGGQVIYRQEVEHIEVAGGLARALRTKKGLRLACEAVVANVTPWALRSLLGDGAPARLTREVHRRAPTWGAFTLYLGLDASLLPSGLPDHHQVVVDPSRPLGEANSIFLSLSDPADDSRAPRGMRACTISTHTAAAPWLALHKSDRAAYDARKADYTRRVLSAAEQALPGLQRAVRLCLPGTPCTFEFFTRRPGGMVGGFAQTSLLDVRGPGTGLVNVWLVGDSVFPGQSTAGATLGGMRVAEAVARRLSPSAGLNRP